MQELRAVFEKTGCSIYISHLDLSRCVARAARRAGIPVWYTEGFNPHPFFTFALPLSLGQSSVCETMDFKLTEAMPFDEITARFNRCMPQGIRVISVAEPKMKHTAIAWARYEMVFALEGCEQDMLKEKLEELMAKPEILVEKKTKSKKLRSFDFKQSVKEYFIEQTDAGVLLNIVLPAGCTDNVNPTLLSAPVAAILGTEDFYLSIKRIGVYTDKMTNFE